MTDDTKVVQNISTLHQQIIVCRLLLLHIFLSSWPPLCRRPGCLTRVLLFSSMVSCSCSCFSLASLGRSSGDSWPPSPRPRDCRQQDTDIPLHCSRLTVHCVTALYCAVLHCTALHRPVRPLGTHEVGRHGVARTLPPTVARQFTAQCSQDTALGAGGPLPWGSHVQCPVFSLH